MKSIFLIATLFVFLGCGKKLVHSPISSGGTPNPVSNPSYLPSPGGVKITYEPPLDVDFLYMEAHYTDNQGRPAQARASVYSDTLVIAGFADREPKNIELFSVNRAGKMSSSVPLTAIPGKPPHLVAAESLEITPYIGSIKYKWANPSGSNLIVDIIADTTKLRKGEEVVRSVYTKNKEESYYQQVRTGPLAYEESVFGAIVRDLYGNRSEIVFSKGPNGEPVQKLVAFGEYQVKRADCEVISIPGDADWNAYGGRPYYIFDNNRGTFACADFAARPFTTYDDKAGGYPYFLTVKLSKKLPISRFVFVERNNSVFRDGPDRFTVYGLSDLPNPMDVSDKENGNPANWVLLQEYIDKSPSGYVEGNGTRTLEDTAYWAAGSNFKLDAENAQQVLRDGVQYLRFEFKKTFISSSFLNIAEVELFAAGDEEGETTPRSF